MIWTMLAQTSSQGRGLDAAHEWFGRSDPTVLKQIVAVLGLIALGILIAWLVSQLQLHLKAPRTRSRPMRLFLRMQSRLGLPMLDRWRLWRLARTMDLRHPTALLISSALFDEAVTKYRSSPARRRVSAASFTVLRSRLFQK
jgi:hypothetical protein